MEQGALGRKLGSFSYNWLYMLFHVISVALLVVACALGSVRPPNETLLILGLSVFTVLALLLWHRQHNFTRFQLYEDGIIVLENNTEKSWKWRELTNVDGERDYVFAEYIIPVLRYGSSQFYVGNEPAFKVAVGIRKGEKLVNYALSRIAEKYIPGHETAIRQGKRVALAGIHIDSEGISDGKKFFRWEQLKSLQWKYRSDEEKFILRINFQENQEKAVASRLLFGNSRVLGSVTGLDAYILIGLLDSLRSSNELREWQQSILK